VIFLIFFNVLFSILPVANTLCFNLIGRDRKLRTLCMNCIDCYKITNNIVAIQFMYLQLFYCNCCKTTTGPEVVYAEKQSPLLSSLRAHCLRLSNYFIKNRQSTCKYTITVPFTDLEKLLSHRKHGNGGDCFPGQ
jgi:hypothetical protein